MNEDIYLQLSRYSQPLLIIFGTIGAILNLVLFCCRKKLRTSSCSVYFRALSANDFLVLYIVVLTQWLTDQFHYDPTTKFNWYCKIRTYLMYCLYALSPYFIVLICVDRFCTSSRHVRLRQMATIRVARQVIPLTIIFILIIHFHILLQFNLVQSVCIPLNQSYFRFLGYFLLVFYCILPPILMSTLCSSTLILLRRRQQQCHRTLTASRTRMRHHQRDYQIMKMVFLYITINIVCTLLFAIVFLLNVYRQDSDHQLLILVKCSVLLVNFNYCTSFYAYTLGTPLYRRELFHLIKILRQRCNLN